MEGIERENPKISGMRRGETGQKPGFVDLFSGCGGRSLTGYNTSLIF